MQREIEDIKKRLYVLEKVLSRRRYDSEDMINIILIGFVLGMHATAILIALMLRPRKKLIRDVY